MSGWKNKSRTPQDVASKPQAESPSKYVLSNLGEKDPTHCQTRDQEQVPEATQVVIATNFLV